MLYATSATLLPTRLVFF